jgi:hypothetical protein
MFLVLKELRATVNNPLDLKNFPVFFAAIYLIIFLPYLLIETSPRNRSACESSLAQFSEIIPSGKGKIFEFVYSSEQPCNISILPQWGTASNLSIWLYKPDRTVESTQPYDSNGKTLTFSGTEQGVYRLSVHNEEDTSVNFNLKISSVPR